MSLNDLVQDAVDLGVSATEYTIKFLQIRDKLVSEDPAEDNSLLDSMARKRTQTYFKAYNKGMQDTVNKIVGEGYKLK